MLSGLVETTLTALTLGIDVAFITIHHLVGIMLAVVVAALSFKDLDPQWKRLESLDNS